MAGPAGGRSGSTRRSADTVSKGVKRREGAGVMTVRTWLGEFLVNDVTAGDQTIVDAAVFPDGRFVVT